MYFTSKWLQLSNIKKKIALHYATLANSPVIKNFFIYSFGSVVLKSISILLAPITLTILNPTDYGLLSLFNSFTNILVVFAGLGLRQAFSIEFFHHDAVSRKTIINDIIGIYLVASLPIYLLLLNSFPLINSYIFINNATNNLITASLMFCFMHFFVELFYQVVYLIRY